MNPQRSSLKKSDILRGYRVFSRVITEGRTFHRGAVRCFVVRDALGADAVRTGFSVSRNVRSAAHRNRARRWMKEAYRKNRALLTENLASPTGTVMIVFLCTAQSRSIHDASARSSVEQSVVTLLRDLHSQLAGKS